MSISNSKYKLLGKALIDKNLISSSDLEKALQEQKRTGEFLGKILLELDMIQEEQLLDVLGEQFNIEVISLADLEIPRQTLDKIPSAVAKIYNVLPIKYLKNILTIAISDPLNISLLDELRFILECRINYVLAKEYEITKKVEECYAGDEKSIGEIITQIEDHFSRIIAGQVDGVNVEEKAKELAHQTPVVKLFNLIIFQAVKNRASDIHFEPFEDGFIIRYRIDGIISEVTSPPKALNLALVSRTKVLANLDVAETRLPQDGRILMKVEDKEIDLRVSTLPTIFGESVVLRVLDKSTVSLSVDQIGLSQDSLRSLGNLIKKPNGLILVTGPTGCGKTTTLYAFLSKINRPELKIITTEDPVEYDIEGIIQTPINPKIGLTFASSLRCILRQDPDVIMVGEIRDIETAEVAIHASLTGHLVLSTLHTNDAASAITRLINIGVEPFLITSTCEAIIAQRLIRVLCTHCKKTYQPASEELLELGISPESGVDKVFFKSGACSKCNYSGFRGRIGIFEILFIDDNIRELIIKRAQTSSIRDCARKGGMRTLREDGILKIFEGLATLEDIEREAQMYI